MSDWTVHLEFEEGTSSKFWRARVEDKTLYVNYGKIGSNGQTQVKDFASPELVAKEYAKLVAEKRKKGYVEQGGAGAAEVDDEADGDEGDGDEGDDENEAPPPKKKPAMAAAPVAKSAARPANGLRLVLEAGARKVETMLVLDGKTVRMDALETYATPEAAKKAYERLRRVLAGESYKEL